MTPRSTRRVDPTDAVERALAAELGDGPRTIVGLDEVGRGALAGPVAVGACAVRIGGVDASVLPAGIRDSKMLSPVRREQLVGPIQEAVVGWGIGLVEPAEIDADGISAALTTAALRALDQLTVPVDAIILDGSVDTISAALQARPAPAVRVLVKVGADRDCVSVAAASILAKVHRDALMVELDAQAPEYGWARNKGYGSAEHREAIARLGAHEQHRRSWRLGTGAPVSSSDRVRTARAPEPPVSAPGVLWEGDWPRAEREESP